MWQRPHHSPPQCVNENPPYCDHQHHSVPVRKLTLGPPKRYGHHSGSHHPHQPHLHFPPPPNYPPSNYPGPSTSKMADDFMSIPGPSTQPDPPWPGMEYSYAYYEPGPPTSHTNVPSKYPGTYREGVYRTGHTSKHTYLTRYIHIH